MVVGSDERVFELRTIRDQPAWLVITRGGGATGEEGIMLSMRCTVGRFGDPRQEKRLLKALERRIRKRGHAVIVTAEGAGQHLLKSTGKTDPSGNPVLGDIASLLIGSIKDHFKKAGMDITLKYIDPSYIIRSVPANTNDRIYCGFLGQNAVHAGMAGKTDLLIGRAHHIFTHVPLSLVTHQRKRVDPDGAMWLAVTEATGQARLHG